MNKIIDKKEYSIFQDNRYNTIFKLELKVKCPVLLKSIINSKILSASTMDTDYKSLKIIARNITSFSDYKISLKKQNGVERMRYQEVLLLLYYLGNQTKYLFEKEEHCFVKIDIDNILVIDDNKFIYVSVDDLHGLDGTSLIISKPFSINKHSFISPELREIKEIPSRIHYKTFLYSLGCLSIFCLSNEYDFMNIEDDEKEKRMSELLRPIEDTKLYWAIKRTLVQDVKNRCLIII